MSDEKRFDMILGKQRARARLREFISKHIMSRKNARVLCLPGENGREIEHVYRKLGFRDENIVGLEADVEVASRVRSHYPRIRTVALSALEFCGQPELDSGDPFSVVSLDYCGSFDESKIDPVGLLAFLRRLSDRCVVAFNLFVGRENSDRQEHMRTHAFGNLHGMGRAELEAFRKDTRPLEERVATVLRKDVPLAEVREHLVLSALMTCLSEANSAYIISTNGLKVPDEIEVVGRDPKTRNYCRRTVRASAYSALNAAVAPAYDKARELLMRGVSALTPSLSAEDLPIYVDSFVSGLFAAFQDYYGLGYVVDTVELYSYINDNGHRMNSDYALLRHYDPFNAPPLLEICDGEVVCVDMEPKSFAMCAGVLVQSYLRARPQIDSKGTVISGGSSGKSKRLPVKTVGPRVDLGGGAVPFDSERVKSRVVIALKKGRSDDEIMAKFPVTVGTLRALRANITMGRL